MFKLAKHERDLVAMHPCSAANLHGTKVKNLTRGLDLRNYLHIIMKAGVDHSALSVETSAASTDDLLSEVNEASRIRARKRHACMLSASNLIAHAYELSDKHRILSQANEHIQEDLRAAALAQRQLLPEMHKDILGFHIASAFVPSSSLSGDMFGYFVLPGNKLGFYAVDVAGHGINASLMSVAIGHLITPEFFNNTAFDPDGAPDLASFVQNLNRRFYSVYNDGYFTMFCAVIDKVSGNMDMCQAGYPAPVYVAPDGRAHFLGNSGFPVGMFPDATYENEKSNIEDGGLLVICSDAASEAEDSQATPFGVLRLRDLVVQLRDSDVDSLPESVIGRLRDWRNGKKLEDDLTVLAIKRTKKYD